MTAIPFSPASERNKAPILEALRVVFATVSRVLEIGSGTGQHAVHFAPELPHLAWQPSDLPVCLDGIAGQIAACPAPNLASPVALDVQVEPWPTVTADGVFSANTAHIMSWQGVEAMFRGVGRLLPPGGIFALYGPFNVAGRYTGEGNAAFDRQLRYGDPRQGIRDVADLNRLATAQQLQADTALVLPADNRLLVWRRLALPGRP